MSKHISCLIDKLAERLEVGFFNLFAIFSVLPGKEEKTYQAWTKAVDQEETRVNELLKNSQAISEQSAEKIFSNRRNYAVLGDSDFVFTCQTTEFRSFNRIGISDFVKDFQFLYGYKLRLRNEKPCTKNQIFSFSKIKIRDHILSALPLHLLLHGFQLYFEKRLKQANNGTEIIPTFTIGWIDLVVLFKGSSIELLEEEIERLSQIKLKHLFDFTNDTKILEEEFEPEELEKIEEVIKNSGHVLTVMQNLVGIDADIFIPLTGPFCKLKDLKKKYASQFITPNLVVSGMPGHGNNLLGMIKKIFGETLNIDLGMLRVYRESGNTDLRVAFGKINLIDYFCGIKMFRKADMFYRLKQNKEGISQKAITSFSCAECESLFSHGTREEIERLEGYYCQFYAATTIVSKQIDLRTTTEIGENEVTINRNNQDFSHAYEERINSLDRRFRTLFGRFQEDNRYWIRILVPFRNIITVIRLISCNPTTLFSLFEMIGFTERALDYIENYLSKKPDWTLKNHSDFIDRLEIILNDLQLCFNNLYREVFPLSKNTDTYICYKGAVQKILSCVYGYVDRIWPVLLELIMDKEEYKGFEDFKGCCVVSFKNYMAMRNTLMGTPVFYLSPDSLFKIEEIAIDIPHEIIHSSFNIWTKANLKPRNFFFKERIVERLCLSFEDEKDYTNFNNFPSLNTRFLHKELLIQLLSYFLSTPKFKSFVEFQKWCLSEELDEWVRLIIDKGSVSEDEKGQRLELMKTLKGDFGRCSPAFSHKIDMQKNKALELCNVFEETICDSVSYLVCQIEEFDNYVFYRLHHLSSAPELWNSPDDYLTILVRLYLLKPFAQAIQNHSKKLEREIPDFSDFSSFCNGYFKEGNWMSRAKKGTAFFSKWPKEELNNVLWKKYNLLLNIYDDVSKAQDKLLLRHEAVFEKINNNGDFDYFKQINSHLNKLLTISKKGIEDYGIIPDKSKDPENNARNLFTERSKIFLFLWSEEMLRRGNDLFKK